MFRFLFGRRGAADMSGRADAGPSRFVTRPHPILARMLAQADSFGADWRNDRDQWRQMTVHRSEATPNDLMAMAHDALNRLPAARLGYRAGASSPETGVLLTVLGDAARILAPGSSTPPDLTEFSSNQMAGSCTAMGDLFSRPWGSFADWPREASTLFGVMLSPQFCRRGPDVDAALRNLLVRIGVGGTIVEIRCEIAEKIVALLNLPRDASPTLAALDADYARRDAIRTEIRSVAGPGFAPLVDALIDRRVQIGKQSQFAGQPEVAHFLARDPATLGGALPTMRLILSRFPGSGYSGWHWLARTGKGFEPSPPNVEIIGLGFHWLTGLILRKRIEIADSAMAHLVRTRVTNDQPLHDDPWRSRHFLNQALKVAASPDGAETRAALTWLIGYQPEGRRQAMPPDWKQPIRVALAGETPAAALSPPALDLANDQCWFLPRLNGSIGELAEHFRALIDPRLHDPAHRAFLDDLVPVITARIAAQRIDPQALEQARMQWRDTRYGTREFQVVHDRFAALEGQLHLVAVLRAMLEYRAKIISHLDAVAPFVARHPAAADRLNGLCHTIIDKSAPTAKWLKEAAAALDKVPNDDCLRVLTALIAVIGPDGGDNLENQHVLRGFIYLAHRWDLELVAPILTNFALRHCFQHEPNQGIRNEKLGNACLWTLIHLPEGAGVPYLARLLARVKYPKIRARIDAALNEAAENAGIPRGTLDEITVPAHDLDAEGKVAFEVGGGRAVVALAGTRAVEISWFSPEGRQIKAPNAAMKADKDALKRVKAAEKEIEADLGTQVVRLQRLYLDDRTWSLDEWWRNYHDHPLMAGLTRRLLWWVDRPGDSRAVLPSGDQLIDVTGSPVAAEGATLRLWHPIDAHPAEVLAWRDRIEALSLVQPFAQIWREIYRITDAERTTGTYSNRWAGHILRQHQAMTLARLNGWTVTHRMWFDVANDEPWHLTLPRHRLVADYWVEGAGDHDDPERLESNAYVYVSSDRLAFSRIAGDGTVADSARGPERADFVPVAEVPPIVLSEVMRHCDLFTAVASIASDPVWRDRGAQAEHPSDWRRAAVRYWEQQSFGALSEAARTRHALLARLVPRLAIADRCTLTEDALRVRGTRHQYRIHLGSAAIFIEDENRHLCIVAAPGSKGEKYYVPFEGDHTTSLIISKAMLLAHDNKITDPTILRQL